jgi:hypothetical protein
MELMPWRLRALEETVAGQARGAPPLVGYADGAYTAASFTDDPGLYLLVPQIAGVSGLDARASAHLLFAALTGLGFALGCAGLFLAFRSWPGRLLGLAGLALLSALTLRIGDVYAAMPAAAMAGILPCLALWKRKTGFLGWAVFCLLAGLVVGVGNSVRVHAATGTLVFILALLVGSAEIPWVQRGLLAALLLTGPLAVSGGTRLLVRERDRFLARHNPEALRRCHGHHAYWHTVYIGLGYVDNPYGIVYRDEAARARAEEVAPGVDYCSPEYDAVLRGECLKLLREDPAFIGKILLAKVAKLLLLLMVFANLGLVAAWTHRKPLAVDVAFGLALGFSSLFGILAVPVESYCLGFIALAALFGVTSLAAACDQGAASGLVVGWRKRRRCVA